MVVIPQGAGGEGTITSVDAAAGNGHSGALGLSFSFICSADGSKISLLDTTQKQTEGDRKGGASAATIIGVATFGVTGLFAHNLARRRRKVVDGKTIMTIQPWS
jgi:hypothetical protein